MTVPDAFVAGAGRTLVSRYRAIVWSGAAAALAISLWLPAPPPSSGRGALLMTGVVAGNMIVALGAWLLAHRKARAHAVPPSDVRVASLVPRDTSLPGGALFAVGPFAILLARRTRQIAVDGPAAAAEQRFRRVNVLVLVLTGYATAILLSATTVESIPAFGDTVSGRVGFLLLPVMLFNFGVTFWMFRVGQGGQRTVAPAARREIHGDVTPDHAWKVGGLFYFNPHDPAIWVENRVGLGYTLNLGNPRAWLLIIGMMLAPMIASRLLF